MKRIPAPFSNTMRNRVAVPMPRGATLRSPVVDAPAERPRVRDLP